MEFVIDNYTCSQMHEGYSQISDGLQTASSLSFALKSVGKNAKKYATSRNWLMTKFKQTTVSVS